MLTLSLLLEDLTVKAEVHDSSFSRSGVILFADFEPTVQALPIGASIKTRLNSTVEKNPLQLFGRLASQAMCEPHIRCGLAYPVQDLSLIRNMLNERTAVRVKPSHAFPIEARVRQGCMVQVHDISTGGIALLLAEEDQAHLSDWTLRFSLKLPNHDEEIEIVGNLRVRTLSGSMILYGIGFDEKKTVDFRQKQALIHRYVMQRQVQFLRTRALRRYS